LVCWVGCWIGSLGYVGVGLGEGHYAVITDEQYVLYCIVLKFLGEASVCVQIRLTPPA
jgi:hypothetical protein